MQITGLVERIHQTGAQNRHSVFCRCFALIAYPHGLGQGGQRAKDCSLRAWECPFPFPCTYHIRVNLVQQAQGWGQGVWQGGGVLMPGSHCDTEPLELWLFNNGARAAGWQESCRFQMRCPRLSTCALLLTVRSWNMRGCRNF